MMPDSEFLRESLSRVAELAMKRGMPKIELKGQLILPSLAYAAAFGGSKLDTRFWNGALAIQLAHEASLIHDDIIDDASIRRGQATEVQSRGVGPALVYGDHLLTASYRLAAETKSFEFVELFSQCVERTVAGEIAQAKSLGTILSFAEYREIAESKSGELLASSLALGVTLGDTNRIEPRARLGREFGLLYQMLDDLLDYCPSTDMGKPSLGDFQQKRWTWPLLEIGEFSFDEPVEDIAARFSNRVGMSPLERCVRSFEEKSHQLAHCLNQEFGDADVGISVIKDWVSRAREAAALELHERGSALSSRVTISPGVSVRSFVPVKDDVIEYLADNSKTFRFASRFFPQRELTSVAHVYAFCRVTDDLVDQNEHSQAEHLLNEWMTLAYSAHSGSRTGISFLDRVMHEMRSRRIPFDYARELAEGMRMDLRGVRYETMQDLRTYTYRVASVVGLWLTRLAGIHDESTLRHAESLGHAMQLTNILRDVGEDARLGRPYLPLDLLTKHGIEAGDIMSAARGDEPIPRGFDSLMEELMRDAEQDYEFALQGVRNLPAAYQRPVRSPLMCIGAFTPRFGGTVMTQLPGAR
ncbi:MAG TPA: squalene/phytoene synthase family protein [Gemmatimonadaceae bacterium]|nr:squalene/phytoene synthase family protein [Gemmatimonadaceae bacterium]